jgi:hypothetical protein
VMTTLPVPLGRGCTRWPNFLSPSLPAPPSLQLEKLLRCLLESPVYRF